MAQIATMDEQVGRVVAALNASGMLDNSVISFSSDNGGPLDHANNYPRRGGKHGFYEGGIRTEAFIWSQRIPQARRGEKYDGLMHLADWRSTLAGGLVGASTAQLDDGAPFATESHDHWAAILGEVPCPRSELIHNVQCVLRATLPLCPFAPLPSSPGAHLPRSPPSRMAAAHRGTSLATVA